MYVCITHPSNCIHVGAQYMTAMAPAVIHLLGLPVDHLVALWSSNKKRRKKVEKDNSKKKGRKEKIGIDRTVYCIYPDGRTMCRLWADIL